VRVYIGSLNKVSLPTLCMDLPVFNRGSYLYSVKLNVTPQEYQILSKHTWHKHKGQPRNYKLGYLFNIVSPKPILYTYDMSLIPVHFKSKCVAYAQIDPEYYHDLIRHTWYIDDQGYAFFFNPILKSKIYMHRYLTNFPNNLIVDHIFWNRLDNRLSALHVCSQSDNAKNMSHRRTLP